MKKLTSPHIVRMFEAKSNKILNYIYFLQSQT